MNKLIKNRNIVRKMTTSDLPLVLEWRNNIDVRKSMFRQHEISKNEHIAWFKQIENNDHIHPLIFVNNNVPLGFVSFTQLYSSPVADWGFYLSPDAEKGTGRLMGLTALEYSFNKLKLHKVSGDVLANNKKSINYHINLGFKQEGFLRQHYYDGNNFLDVFNFGLLVNEWNDLVNKDCE